jgi:hypothetical protein
LSVIVVCHGPEIAQLVHGYVAVAVALADADPTPNTSASAQALTATQRRQP